jgi:hypothetical protein
MKGALSSASQQIVRAVQVREYGTIFGEVGEEAFNIDFNGRLRILKAFLTLTLGLEQRAQGYG